MVRRRLFLVTIVINAVVLFCNNSPCIASGASQFDVDVIDKVIQRIFDCHSNPGVIVSVVRNGTVLFAKGYGQTDLERGNPVDSSTVFNVASLSKNLAAALLVKLLYTKTNLTVDSKVRDLVGTDFRMLDNFRTSEMTFADVMGHRTAVPPNNIIRFDFNLTRKDVLKRLSHLATPDEFRVKYYYNNLMYGVVTYLAELLGGDRWEALIQKHFFDPLGMHKSTFVTQVDYRRDDVAWPYVVHDDRLLRVPFEHSRRWGLLAGSVALATTADDMAKWMNFHLSKGRNRDGAVVMEQTQLSELYTPRMALPSPAAKDFSVPTMPHTLSKNSYTFGLRRGFYRGYTRFSHSGSNHGFRALMSLLPTEGVGVFMAMNGRDDHYQLRQPLNMYLTDLALGLKPWLNASTLCSYPYPWTTSYPSNPPTNEIDESIPLLLDSWKYEGTYHNDAYGYLNITLDASNRLVLTYGWATWILIPRRAPTTGTELFYGKGTNLTVAYNVDPIEFITEASVVTSMKAKGFETNAPPVFTKLGANPDQRSKDRNNGSSQRIVPYLMSLLSFFLLQMLV